MAWFTRNPPYSILPYSSAARAVQLLPLGKRADSPEVSPRRGRGQKHQTKLADLDFVVVGQHGRVHGFAVDVRAVEAAGVDDAEFVVFTPELGVAAAHSDVVEKNVAVRMAARRREIPVQQESGPGVGPAPDDQKGRAARQVFESRHCAFVTGWGRLVQPAKVVRRQSCRGFDTRLM